MAFEQKEGQGVLWPNDYKEKPNHPDYKGTALVNNTQVEIAAWIKPGRNGSSFLSLSIKPKQERAEGRRGPDQRAQPAKEYDSDLPF